MHPWHPMAVPLNPSVQTMNSDSQRFVHTLLGVILSTLFAVGSVAFVSIPYALGYHPGDIETASPEGRHLT